MTDLGHLPGDLNAHAVALNDRGQVAGNSYVDIGYNESHPFLWQAGVMVPLNLEYRVGSFERATAMNDSGVVVGDRDVLRRRVFHAMAWEQGSAWDLGTLTPDSVEASSSAWAINNRGTVVGHSDGRAVIWRRTEVLAAAP